MRSDAKKSSRWMTCALLAATAGASLPAQVVQATASVLTSANAFANSMSSSLPAGTPIVQGTNVTASSGVGTAASTTFGLAVAADVVTYTVSQSLQVLPPGFAGANSETVLQITAPQTLAGTLTVLATSGPLPGGGSFAIDIGNDGSIELTGTGQQTVVVAGVLDVRVVASDGLALLSGGSMLQGSSVGLTFTPFGRCASRNGTGANPDVCSCDTLPVVGQNWVVAIAPAASTVATFAFGSLLPLGPVAVPFGELLIEPVGAIQLPGSGIHTAPLPYVPALVGLAIHVQGLRLNAVGGGFAIELTNAVDGVLGS